jgi:hypothetical protein
MPDPPVVNSFGPFTPLVDLFYEFTGTGAPKANRRDGGTHPRASTIDRYSVLAYGNLQGENSYTNLGYKSPSETDASVLEVHTKTKNAIDRSAVNAEKLRFRNKGKNKMNVLDGQSNNSALAKFDTELNSIVKTDTMDGVNAMPYGGKLTDLDKNNTRDDFIPFKFRDAINGKWLIFRAILGTITDTLSPDWSSDRYIGRPDQVHVYQGTNRQVTFDFKIYPNTKQELLILWDKLNFLVGLTYPTYKNNRMVPPFTYLTIGKIFNKTPGFISGLTVNIPEETTWEIDNTRLKLPKYVTVNCDYTYIHKNLPMTTGKHYDLPWLKHYGKYGTYNVPPTVSSGGPARTNYTDFWKKGYDYNTETWFENPLGAVTDFMNQKFEGFLNKNFNDLKKQIFRRG